MKVLKEQLSYAVEGIHVKHYEKGTPADQMHPQAAQYADKNDLLVAPKVETKDKNKDRK